MTSSEINRMILCILVIHKNGLHISHANSPEKSQQYLKHPAVDWRRICLKIQAAYSRSSLFLWIKNTHTSPARDALSVSPSTR
jgi:hypothetical protein